MPKGASIVHVFSFRVWITLQAYLSVHPQTKNSNHFQLCPHYLHQQDRCSCLSLTAIFSDHNQLFGNHWMNRSVPKINMRGPSGMGEFA